jgi:hypothetical protein
LSLIPNVFSSICSSPLVVLSTECLFDLLNFKFPKFLLNLYRISLSFLNFESKLIIFFLQLELTSLLILWLVQIFFVIISYF